MMHDPQTLARAQGQCELCGAQESLQAYAVEPRTETVGICATCLGALDTPETYDQHWRCLLSSMWSEVPAVQITAWRVLSALKDQGWASDALDMLYLDADMLEWAQAGVIDAAAAHRDSNGAVLAQGDTIVLIKDLPVKGAGFTAKRGTAVRGISLVADNPAHIEGRVEGQRIVILTEFVKKK